MANATLDYLRKQGTSIIETALRRVAGKPAATLTNEAHYRQAVIQPAWGALPPPLRRLLAAQYPRWDQLFLALRGEAFQVVNGTLAVRPDLTGRVVALLWEHFGLGHKDAEPPPNGPPLAGPVAPGEEVPGPVPVARPVHQAAVNGAAVRAADVPVGIDLGTTYSVIAYLDPQGRPCSVPNAAGDILTPSVVLFDEGAPVVGKEAVRASALEPEKVAECVKRDMGAQVYRQKINGEHLPPEVISSFILRSLKADAERKLGRPVTRAVVTVPAYFDERRRRATVDAGKLARLEVLAILNEPTAAAIAYGHQEGFLDRACRPSGDRPLRVLVFDLGGGTFDVTVVELGPGTFRALATDGDVSLGGKEWDDRLVDLAAEAFRRQFREDPRANPVSLQELRLAAEAAKRTLTERPRAALFVHHLGSRLKVEVTRAEFEEATADLLGRTRLTAEIVARAAGLAWPDLDKVLLVGGSTRMPMVVDMLRDLTGQEPDHSVAVDEAVAHGAALYAHLLAAPKAAGPADFTVTNVSAHSLGIRGTDPKTGRHRNRVLLPRNTPLPRTVTREFRTYQANQRAVTVRVLEGESDRPEACSAVGVCSIRDLPAGLPAGWPVQVSYTYEADGRLHVSAKLKGRAEGVTTDFVRENSLPDEDLELWARCIDEELHPAAARG